MRMGLKENRDSTDKPTEGKENDEGRERERLDRERDAQEHMHEEGIARKMTPINKV